MNELVKPRKHFFTPREDDFDTCLRCGHNVRSGTMHCMGDERPENDAQYIERLESALRRLAEAGTREAEPVAHRKMTREEYNALNLKGWHSVRHDNECEGVTEVSYIAPTPSALINAPQDDVREALLLFRAFVMRNVTQWQLGAGSHHHPMWQYIAKALGDMNRVEVTSGERWAFIQPDNKTALRCNQSDGGTHPSHDIRGLDDSIYCTVCNGVDAELEKPCPSYTTPSTRPEVSVEELARFMDPAAFDDDPNVRHRYCSPLKVEVVQERAREYARALKAKYHMEGRE